MFAPDRDVDWTDVEGWRVRKAAHQAAFLHCQVWTKQHQGGEADDQQAESGGQGGSQAWPNVVQ